MDQCDKYIEMLNKNLLPFINYDRLQDSYTSEDKSYAKMTLYTLHEIAEQVYGPSLSCNGNLEFAVIPGVICSMETGKVCLALLGIDLYSSGELCSANFLTKYGVVLQGQEGDAEIKTFMSKNYGPYHYGFTLPVAGDIHQSSDAQPQAIKEILSTFQTYAAELTDSILQGKYEDGEDLDR